MNQNPSNNNQNPSNNNQNFSNRSTVMMFFTPNKVLYAKDGVICKQLKNGKKIFSFVSPPSKKHKISFF
ncbi:MAG: hypothetical protein NZZ41_04645 [Candidatus Dojkabacteria bacterium]|nr:hypothetical protein [Candidatus Dojkabacteria bacterium]